MILNGKVITECHEGELDCPTCSRGQSWPDEFNDEWPNMYSEATCKFCGSLLVCHSVDVDEQGFPFVWNWMVKKVDTARETAQMRREESPYKRGEV